MKSQLKLNSLFGTFLIVTMAFGVVANHAASGQGKTEKAPSTLEPAPACGEGSSTLQPGDCCTLNSPKGEICNKGTTPITIVVEGGKLKSVDLGVGGRASYTGQDATFSVTGSGDARFDLQGQNNNVTVTMGGPIPPEGDHCGYVVVLGAPNVIVNSNNGLGNTLYESKSYTNTLYLGGEDGNQTSGSGAWTVNAGNPPAAPVGGGN